jgi:tetratricopeptide (TPR) repeat protein
MTHRPPPPVTVFLSAVSREFHEPDPESPRRFPSYRDVLSRALRSLGPGFSVIVQEELAQGPGDLLATLDTEIRRSETVVHLVGNLAGSGPSAAELRRLRERHPKLLEHEPELAEDLKDLPEFSYTQWEIYLAFEHRLDHRVFVAEPHTIRSPSCPTHEMEPSQVKHLARLRRAGEHWETFENQDQLALMTVTSIIRFGYDPKATDFTPRPEAVEAARKDPAGLVREVAEGIRKPDRSTAALLEAVGVEAYLRPVTKAALRRELDRRTALEIVAEHRTELQEAVKEQPTIEGLSELALAELAMGNYPGAMEAARRWAEMAEARMVAEPDRFEQHREAALNGYLLLHDAARAAGRRDEAVAALRRGGALIDASREPVFWADYHEPLAEFHLDQAHWERAEELINAITDIREEHQAEQPALAKSLLLWCRSLESKADYSGVVGVAARAERIYAEQVPPERLGVASALNCRAIALRRLGRFAEAEPLFRPSLAILEGSYGPEHPQVAAALGNLAGLLQETNRAAEAEPLYRRALAIDEGSYGPDHPQVAVTLGNLAGLLQKTNRLAEAEPLYRRSLAILEGSYGPDHPDLAVALGNLAGLLAGTNRAAEAEPLSRRSLEIFLKFTTVTGHEHPHLRGAMALYASLLEAMGSPPEQIHARLDEILRPFGLSLGGS